ncbi:hypothetical protein AB0M28_28795 [Streptomyces sp. NPDC051940]|uniref:hypothetical protein n=1 Tax=Streptomyces sp. NPDC051940 TaxID=3155675 RepID=UPI003435F92E
MSRGDGPDRTGPRPTAVQLVEDLHSGSGTVPDRFADFDADAGLERVARRVLWEGALSMDERAWTAVAECRPPRTTYGRWQSAARPAPAHVWAGLELQRQSVEQIRDPQAVAAMGRFAREPDWRLHQPVDVDGVLAFACVLYLADRVEGARFWWQFAAGADSATAARCLYLHHLHHGETDDARHWEAVEARLRCRTPGPARAWFEPRRADYVLAGMGSLCDRRGLVVEVKRYHDPAWIDGGVTMTVRLDAPLAEAVHRLRTYEDADLGPIPLPDTELATELMEECATAGS